MIAHKYFDSDHSLQLKLAKLINERKLVPVIGSGFTRGCPAKKGSVPSGEDMTNHMKEFLSNKYGKKISEFATTSFSKLCTGFEKQTSVEEKFEYFSSKFTKVQINKNQLDFLSLAWPYLYTLNIDDGIEGNSSFEVILPKKEFYDRYIEEFNSIFKIHGDVHNYLKYLGDDKNREDIIFNKKQYIDSLKSNKKMLAKFEDDFGTSNLLYIGCSLDDEPDLLSVIGEALKNSHTHRETYYVSHRKLDQEMQDILEDYGITTCVVVSDYNLFYSTIVKQVTSLPKTKSSFIEFYLEPEIMHLNKDSSNLNFMLSSDNLIPTPYKRKIHKPHFFIERSVIASKVLEELKFNSPIHIIYGHRISGKTYCLFGLYENIKDKERYFFPSNTDISDNSIEELMSKRNVALFFDTQALTSKQLTRIIDAKDRLIENNTYVISCINTSDRYAVNLIADNINYKATPLSSVFDKDEAIALNSIFESSNMPRFGFVENIFDKIKSKNIRRYFTILDNLFRIAIKFGEKNVHYAYPKLSSISTEQDLAIIILLATQQAITSYDMYYFDIVKECSEFSDKFPMLAEWVYIDDGLSRRGSKQRLNANTRYYLLKILGEYSADIKKHSIIINAYKYIYAKIAESETDSFDITRKMLDFIKFDVINDIFYRKNNSAPQLIKNIYEALEPDMNTNSQFKHQRAKSILWLSKDDLEEISKAIGYIDLAYHNTETLLRARYNRFLNISLGHISYTRALLYGRRCSIQKYSNEDNIKSALSYYREALLNPINREELDALRTQKADRRIRDDLQKLVEYILTSTDIDADIFRDAEGLRIELNCF